jgi:hypothetical protein
MAQYAGSFEPDYTVDYSNPDYHEHDRKESAWLENLKANLRSKSKGDLVGELLKFPAADGYARYIITKQRPLTVAHLSIGDAWQADGATIRGIRLQDAKARVASEREQRKFFDDRIARHETFYKSLSVGDIVHLDSSFNKYTRCEVVLAAEDDGHMLSPVKKGDKVLKSIALVGNWGKVWDSSYEGKKIVEGKTSRPGAHNIFESACYEGRGTEDPAKMEPHTIHVTAPKLSHGERIVKNAVEQEIDLNSEEGRGWLENAIDSI